MAFSLTLCDSVGPSGWVGGQGRARAGLGCWLLARLGLGFFAHVYRNLEANEHAVRSEIHTTTIYQVLDGLGFRGLGV